MNTKHNILAISLLFFLHILNAQQWSGTDSISGSIFRNGNVGIGIDIPLRPLHVNGDILSSTAIISDGSWGKYYASFSHKDMVKNGGYAMMQASWGETFINAASGFPIHFLINDVTKMYLSSNGRVGIGSMQPQELLEVKGGSISLRASSTEVGKLKFVKSDGIQQAGIFADRDGTRRLYFSTQADNTPNLFIDENGSIGINTVQCGDGKLAVNGKIIATAVEVKAYPWADYVFDENYKLLRLEEVEQFILSNHHLPEVPSASEVEENGINVAEMNSILLKKIEELTLYVIELKKEIKELQDLNGSKQ
ncbi:MAG: hypothetical protein JXB00_04550 [Bacteroidales bacterium]|nr:hypothetical protein [Bacteroidales bacterium]